MYGGVRGVLRQLMAEPSTRLCFRTLFSVLLIALAKTYSFAIFGLCGGWCELQMCMALYVG